MHKATPLDDQSNRQVGKESIFRNIISSSILYDPIISGYLRENGNSTNDMTILIIK
jgi:hypothetical protein